MLFYILHFKTITTGCFVVRKTGIFAIFAQNNQELIGKVGWQTSMSIQSSVFLMPFRDATDAYVKDVSSD